MNDANGMYYTPERVADYVAGSGSFLVKTGDSMDNYNELENEFRTVVLSDGTTGIIPSLNSVMRSCDADGVVDMDAEGTWAHNYKAERDALQRELNDARRWARAWKKAAQHYRGEYMDALMEDVNNHLAPDEHGVYSTRSMSHWRYVLNELVRCGMMRIIDQWHYTQVTK